jgi:iron complex outermembrane recepter protein
MRILLSILFLSANYTFGQITGTVKTAKDEPIPFANLILFDVRDSTIIVGSSTDELGKFSIKSTKLGEAFLKISSIGYKNYSSKVFIINNLLKNIEIGDLILLDENNVLNEITVSAKKQLIETTPTGKIINIQSSLMTKGSNALQVLERLPGVITDRNNNQFSLNGQSGVTILFNGRRVQMNMDELMSLLENTVADNIEKIELITSPTAQYDADGGAGIINIIFKNNETLGTKINFLATAGYGFREKAVTSIGLSQGFKNLNFNASYSFLHDVSRSGFKGFGTSDKTFLSSATSADFSGISRRFQDTHNANLTAEYKLNSKITLGGDLFYSLSNAHNLANNNVAWDFENGDYISFKALSDGQNKRQNIISSVYFKNKIREKSQLGIDLSYIKYDNNSPTLINSDYFDKQGGEFMPENPIFTAGNRGESLSGIQVGVAKMDFNTEINPKINAEFGAKFSYAENTNDSKVERKVNETWEIDPCSQSVIESQERIAAAYSQFKFLLNTKSSLHLGLRYEYWLRNINIYEDAFKIAQFFPSILYTKTVNDNSNFSLNYSRRISRPAYSDLVSNLFYNDPTFVFSGNPLLKPTLTDVLKADYTIKGFNIGLSYQYDKNLILRYQITSNASKDIGISSPQNLDFQKSVNLFLSYPIQIKDWWKLTFSNTASVRNYKVSYSLNPAEKTFFTQNMTVSQSLQLPKNFEVELSGWYNFAAFEGTNSRKGFGVLNLGIAKKLNNDKGILQLALPDLFRSFSVFTHIGGMTPIVFNIDTHTNWRDETAFYRVIKLTYSRSFGKNTRKIENKIDAEERNRVGN